MAEVQFRDDPAIQNHEVMLRRLQPEWLVPGGEGRLRIASAAFKNEELSVLFRSLLFKQQRPIEDALAGRRGQSLCSIAAGLARELDQGVVYDTAPPNDPAHGLVLGKKTRAVANRLARTAAWVIPPEAPLVVD
jgi:hypothetical protein